MMTSARRHSVTCINYLITSDLTLERDHLSVNTTVVNNILKLEIVISTIYHVQIEKVTTFSIPVEKNWSDFLINYIIGFDLT